MGKEIEQVLALLSIPTLGSLGKGLRSCSLDKSGKTDQAPNVGKAFIPSPQKGHRASTTVTSYWLDLQGHFTSRIFHPFSPYMALKVLVLTAHGPPA